MIDTARIFIKAGDGGDGCVSFHRAKFVPKGGPDGGDGGNGGNIIMQSTRKLHTLSIFRRKRQYIAENGEAGMKQKKHGKHGNDLIIEIPIGTQVQSADQEFIHDFDKEETVVIAEGGTGGMGNIHFKSSTNQTPLQFTKGTKGKSLELNLELKILADIGLIGLPSSGKSTLLNALTNSKAKTASYHFTTLEPNLGILSYHKQEIVLADIPGLIEGASSGKGLGHDFLRHIERTRALVHIIDGYNVVNGPDTLVTNYEIIRNELKQWKRALLDKTEIVVINKMDLTDVQNNRQKIVEIFDKKLGISPIFISALSRKGLDDLVEKISQIYRKNAKEPKIAMESNKNQRTFNLHSLPNRRIVFRKTNHEDISKRSR